MFDGVKNFSYSGEIFRACVFKNVSKVVFSSCFFHECSFEKSELEYVHFGECMFYRCDFSNTKDAKTAYTLCRYNDCIQKK
jgi:uncharacterized protein YjbI with pentapeptide repeats